MRRPMCCWQRGMLSRVSLNHPHSCAPRRALPATSTTSAQQSSPGGEHDRRRPTSRRRPVFVSPRPSIESDHGHGLSTPTPPPRIMPMSSPGPLTPSRADGSPAQQATARQPQWPYAATPWRADRRSTHKPSIFFPRGAVGIHADNNWLVPSPSATPPRAHTHTHARLRARAGHPPSRRSRINGRHNATTNRRWVPHGLPTARCADDVPGAHRATGAIREPARDRRRGRSGIRARRSRPTTCASFVDLSQTTSKFVARTAGHRPNPANITPRPHRSNLTLKLPAPAATQPLAERTVSRWVGAPMLPRPSGRSRTCRWVNRRMHTRSNQSTPRHFDPASGA
jgi:hypothetical protein